MRGTFRHRHAKVRDLLRVNPASRAMNRCLCHVPACQGTEDDALACKRRQKPNYNPLWCTGRDAGHLEVNLESLTCVKYTGATRLWTATTFYTKALSVVTATAPLKRCRFSQGIGDLMLGAVNALRNLDSSRNDHSAEQLGYQSGITGHRQTIKQCPVQLFHICICTPSPPN